MFTFTRPMSSVLYVRIVHALTSLNMAIRNFTEGWKRPTIRWSNAMPEFALLYGERFTAAAE